MAAVQLVDYDAGWPAQFDSLRSAILRAIPDARVEHIGSTAVPGCTAKPVIDISVGLAPDSAVRDATFRSAGLVFRSVRPYSLVFAVDHPDGSRHANVHVRYRDTESELRDLRFRDYLRSHPEAVRGYVAAKRDALVRSAGREDYTRAKSPFILRLQGEASQWAERTRWTPGRSSTASERTREAARKPQ